MGENLVDQLGSFADIAQEKATRRMRVESEELDAWYQELAKPLTALLDMSVELGLLGTHVRSDGEVLQARQEARACFIALRRFFDPASTRSGMEDSLRRCVNRFQRLRPTFKASVSKSSSMDTVTTCSPETSEGSSAADALQEDRPVSSSSRRSSCSSNQSLSSSAS